MAPIGKISSIIFLLFIVSHSLSGRSNLNTDSFRQVSEDYYLSGQYVEAVSSLQELLAHYRKNGNSREEVNTLITIAEVQRASKLFDFGLKNLERAEEIALKEGYDTLSARIYNRFSAIHYELRNRQLCIGYAEKSLGLEKDKGLNKYTASNLALIGLIYRERKDTLQGINYLKRSLLYASKANNADDIVTAYFNLAYFYLNMGRSSMDNNLDTSLHYALKAIQVAEDNSLRTRLPDIYSMTSRIYYKMDNFKKAYNYYDEFFSLRDTLGFEESTTRIERLSAQHESDRMEWELQRITEQNEQNRYILLFVVIILVLLTIFIIYQQRHLRKLRRLNDSLDEQKIALKEADDLKVKLFSIVAHDLRNPIASLSSTLEILLYDELDDASSKKLLKRLNIDLLQTQELTNNLLRWSRSQLVKSTVSPEPIEVNPVVNRVLKQQEIFLKNKEIDLTVSSDEDLKAYCDPDSMEFIFRNLLNNAIKFTKRGGNIDIKIWCENEHVVLQISDSGIGIPEQKQPFLFEIMGKNTYGTEQEKGTGLGLPLCYDFALKNKGSLSLESTGPDGTTFSLRLPTV